MCCCFLSEVVVSLAGEEEEGPRPGSLRQTSHFSRYLQELVDLHLAVLVEVHLVQDLVQRVLIDVDVDVLRRRGGDWSAEASDLISRQTVKVAMTHVQDSLDVHRGNEAFPLLVKLVETLFVPVASAEERECWNRWWDGEGQLDGERAESGYLTTS